MYIRGRFLLLTFLLAAGQMVVIYKVYYATSMRTFCWLELIVVISVILLVLFYKRVVKPIYLIGNGMELLKEQDSSSRLGKVGQSDADRVVEVFNRMMDQLKKERLHVREQNHFLDLLINASPMGVLILDLDRRILSINPAACRILGGIRSQDWMGKPLASLENPLAKELRSLPLFGSRTVRLGDASIYKCIRSSFVDSGYSHTFYLIESLTDEVFRAERKAYEKVIRMISHEVNNTTAGITSTLDTLQSTFQGMPEGADICEVLQVSIDRCYSMSRFISNFADVIRIPEPCCRPTSLNQVAGTCKRFMETVCQEQGIDLRLELCEPSPIVEIDSPLFEQVLVNIIKNALESIGRKGHIIIQTFADPPGIEIADTGKGISKETESKLFTPFFSTKPNGQGLGLIFIREVLDKHHCLFSLRTYPDGFTRFKIAFPPSCKKR